MRLVSRKGIQLKRQQQVFPHTQSWDQIEELENEADIPASEKRALVLGKLGDANAIYQDFSIRGGVDTAYEVYQGGLARTARTCQRNELTLKYGGFRLSYDSA